MAANAISLNTFKGILNYTIDNNRRLQEEKGDKPIALGLVGEKGIGKTSILQQIAEERGMDFVKVNVAQFDEVGDITGFPIKEYEAQLFTKKENEDGTSSWVPGKTVWGTEQTFSTYKGKFRYTGKNRMTYAKPAWVPEESKSGNGTLLVLDDYSRATPVFLNAMMDLIKDQEYMSWKLPKNTQICLTTNPDNGAYNVSTQDAAQSGRYVDFNIEFDLNDWGQWAEKKGLDSRCISFALSYGDELFSINNEGNSIADPRSFVMFANMVSGVKDWDDENSQTFIENIAKGCFKDGDNKFGKMFRTFINNKIHLLISPKQMLTGSWETVKPKLEEAVYDNNKEYRPDIASLLARRFSYYVNAWLDSKEETPIAKVKERILDFIRYNDKGPYPCLFTEDMFYHMITIITSDHKAQTNKLLYEPDIVAKIN